MGFFDFIFDLFNLNNYDEDEEEVEEKEENNVYSLKKSQITNCEKYFFNILNKYFSNEYDIRPQVPLSSIIEKKKNYSNEYQNELNRIVDFGIFDKTTQEPILLIEINDRTHYTKIRRLRDEKVQHICSSAGIKLIKFWTKFENSEEYIFNRVSKELKK